MGKALENKLKKQAALMKSAYELFTTKGFSSTTIMDIAQRAGVAKGTFYLYFKDKVDIREKVIRKTSGQLLIEACNSLDEHIALTGEPHDTAEIFIYTINYLIDAVADDHLLVRFLSKHLSWGMFSDNAAGKVSASGEPITFEEFIRAHLEEHNVEIKDLNLLLFTLLELVSSTCHDVILYEQPMPLDEYKPYLNNCIRLLVNSSIA